MKQATKPNIMKTSNRKLVLDLIRLHPYSRTEIADMTQLSRASVTIIVDELILQGLVCESEGVSGTSGRRPMLLHIVKDARYILSVCIMRHSIQVGIVDLGGSILCECTFPSDLSPRDTIVCVTKQMDVWRMQYGIPPQKMLGVGIMAPGPLSYLEGRLLNPFGMSQWHNVPVADMLSEATGLTTILERDTNALALEEKYFGSAQDIENFIAIKVDVGVGSGIIVHNRLYRGANGLGTEIGHVSINYDGPPCKCGSQGCLEQYISMPTFLNGTPFASWREAMDAAEDRGDVEAHALIDKLSQYLSIAIVGVINMFDLERVFLLGDISYRSEALIASLNRQVASRVIMQAHCDARLVESSPISYSVRTGAMSMLHTFYHERR